MRLGRWLSNEHVTAKELIKNITSKNISSTRERHILGIQDTTEINYQDHAGRVTGLGTVGNGKDVGFFIHPMLLVDAELETCLGIGSIKTWVRTTKARADYPKQPIEEKESFRWLETAEQTKNNLPEVAKLTIIADRESDIYEEWDRIPDQKTHMITRSCRDRKLSTGLMLYAHVQSLEMSGLYEFEVEARVGKRSAHKARLEVRFGEIEIKRPNNCSDKSAANFQICPGLRSLGYHLCNHVCLVVSHCKSNIAPIFFLVFSFVSETAWITPDKVEKKTQQKKSGS